VNSSLVLPYSTRSPGYMNAAELEARVARCLDT
jgi:hypothetical protein